jgi:hypothetical protein
MKWIQFIYEMDAETIQNSSLYIEASKKSSLMRSSLLNWRQFIYEMDPIHL